MIVVFSTGISKRISIEGNASFSVFNSCACLVFIMDVFYNVGGLRFDFPNNKLYSNYLEADAIGFKSL